MDSSFASKKLAKLCADRLKATMALGADSARKLGSRLEDLQAAVTVAELIAGRLHPLSGSRAGQFALDLAGGQRVVFRAARQGASVTGADWKRVTAIEIVFIGDYRD